MPRMSRTHTTTAVPSASIARPSTRHASTNKRGWTVAGTCRNTEATTASSRGTEFSAMAVPAVHASAALVNNAATSDENPS